MTRLQEGYELPKSQWGNYAKFPEGETIKFRILTSPIVGWEYFNNDNKPVKQKAPFSSVPSDSKEWRKPKEFWAFVIWNYNEEKVQIMEITQNSIKQDLFWLSRDSDWGNPMDYDIKITRTGKGLETKYNTVPWAKTEFVNEKAKKEAEGIRLEVLYDGDDPFKPF